MIPRISLALLAVLSIFSTVNAFLTHGTGLVRMTRPFLSTSDESNLQQQEMKGLKDKIVQYERELLTVADSGERTALRNQITANTNLLNTLKSQQGNLPHIFPFFFTILSITFFLPNNFRHRIFSNAGLATTKGK